MSDIEKTFPLTEDEINNLRDITLLYNKVKKLIIEVEEWNDKKAFAPTLLELRNSLDHLMRFYAFKFGFKSDVGDDYSEKNLFKSKGHLYRAGYDSLDYLSIEISESILERVEPFSTNAIVAAIPEYFEKIRPEMDEISQTIANIRSSKDMDNKGSQDIDLHITQVERLRSYHQEILKKINSLNEYEEREKMKIQSNSFRDLKILVLGTVIGGIILAVIMLLLNWGRAPS
jgi:hypothetical protein